MKFSVVLDNVCSSIVPSDNGMTWTQAIKEVVDYCRDAGYDLQAEYFEVVGDNKDEYLEGTLPVVLV